MAFLSKKIVVAVIVFIGVMILLFSSFVMFYDSEKKASDTESGTQEFDPSFFDKLDQFVDSRLPRPIKKTEPRIDRPGVEHYEESEIFTYPIKMQLKGIIQEYKKNILTIMAEDYQYEIVVPEEVNVRCIPKTMTDANGNEIEASKMFLDFSKSTQQSFKKIEVEENVSLFKEGEILTVIAEENEKNIITAQSIVGYGCEDSRELKVDL